MKTRTIRTAFVSANIALGILSSLLVAGGIRLFGGESADWLTTLFIGGVFALIFVIAQLVLLSFWVLPPLRQFIQLAALSEKGVRSFPSISTQIREFHELARILHENVKYSNRLVYTSNKLLESGEQPEIKLRSQEDFIGKAFHRLVNTINELEDVIDELTRGHLFVNIPEKLQTTKVGKTCRVMTLEIRRAIARVRHETQNISRASAEIAAMAQQGARNAIMETQAVESISASISQVAESLKDGIENIRIQVESLDNTFAAIEKMITSIDEINLGTEEISSAAEVTLRSISEIHEFMKEIEGYAHSSTQVSETVSNQAKEGLQAVGDVIDGINTIKMTVGNAATAIQRLGEESGRIQEILSVINDVAEQTNLLALNASIIAAQAGEHGRGFAVVAGEIKELADRTRASTKEIAEIIRAVQAEVTEGMLAMKSCLEAVDNGVALANKSGEVLKKIVQSIQGAKKMVATMARATATQTENSLQVKQSTEQVTQKLEEFLATIKQQATESAQIAELTAFLKQITQQIQQSAVLQLQESETIVHEIGKIQGLVNRNSRIAQRLAQSSNELGQLESNLAETMGQFFIKEQSLPAHFDPNRPTIAFVRRSSRHFFDDVSQGFQDILSKTQFQSIVLNSENDPVAQVENVNWLMQQRWLKGIILVPVDEQIGIRLIIQIKEHHIPFIVADSYIENAGVIVTSENERGGEYVAEILREKLPEDNSVIVYGFRNVNAVRYRMNGFFEKAKFYQWRVVEHFTSSGDIEQAKASILEGLEFTPEAQGVFLVNEALVLTYLELLKEGRLPKRKRYVVGYDLTPKIANAIANGYLLGTVVQDPVQLGRIATQELLDLLQKRPTEMPGAPKKIFVPVKKVTKENLGVGQDVKSRAFK